MGGENPPLFELLFETTALLCEKFHGLTPISVRESRAGEVFLLMRRFTTYNRRKEREHNKPKRIMRPAGDNWF